MGLLNSRNYESIIKGSSIIPVPISIAKSLKSLCKIVTSNKVASGFLIKFFKGDKNFFCLMTNEHIITKEIIKKKEKINFYYDSENKGKEIYLNDLERFINDFSDNNLDISIIQILPKDDIDKDYFY